MTSEEELKKLNRLIHQYETVFRTTKSDEQRERVAKQLKELRASREAMLGESFIDVEKLQRAEALQEYKHLRRLREAESHRPSADRVDPLAPEGAERTPAQEEMFNIMLYGRFFKNEFLPLLAEKRLKLDYKFSIERAGFYTKFNELERKLDDYRQENSRLGTVGREVELDMRKRADGFKRQTKVEAAKFFSAVHGFCAELISDADGDSVKCLNGSEEIVFDDIDGAHLLEGRRVRDALATLSSLASEVVAYLKVPGNDR